MSDVLVAYGSKYGATAGIAEAVGRALREAGLEVDVRRASDVRSFGGYRAVVLGSAVYTKRWRRDAMRLLRRKELVELPVWLFSSGPVGEVAEQQGWTRPKAVEQRAAAIGAREHVVFGGMVAEDRGFIRKKMARSMPAELRDQRDWDEIAAWGRGIATTLQR